MAANFPDNPSNGDTFTSGALTFTWNGSAWKLDPSSGTKGDTGQKGEVGVTGDKGQKGEKGEVGSKGDKGDIGPQGGSGGAGDKGQKGEVGSGGSDGDKGQKGEAGAAASKGQKGEKGQIGADGGSGADGSDGSKGQKGEAAAGTNGIVKQVLSQTTNSTVYYNYYQGPIDSGLSLTINCADANNKILIEYTIYGAGTADTSSSSARYYGSRLLRGSTVIAEGGSNNKMTGYTNSGNALDCHSFSYLDTPGAGNHTYKVQVRHHLGPSYGNYLIVNRSRDGNYTTASTITCSEIEV